jgi:hypothetical protein
MAKQQNLKHVSGAERTHLEQLIKALELWSETERSKNRLVSASELMQATQYLRRLCPPTSPIHDRAWNNGDLFPAEVAVAAPAP